MKRSIISLIFVAIIVFLIVFVVAAPMPNNERSLLKILIEKLDSVISQLKELTNKNSSVEVNVESPNITLLNSDEGLVTGIPLRGRIVLANPDSFYGRFMRVMQVVAMPKAVCQVTFYASDTTYNVSEAKSATEFRNTINCVNDQLCSGRFDFTDDYYMLAIIPGGVYSHMHLAYNCVK